MTTKLKIDFVSDVSCPWCVIGLKSLDQALERVRGDISAELHFQPFELNPQMAPEGQEITEHITQKYGITAAQAQANRENIRARGAQVGFKFSMADEPGGGRSRIYNTFDAHRLLHWAELESPAKQKVLKETLFKAYFTDGQSPASHDVLVKAAVSAGLDEARAREVLASDEYADDVREREQFYLTQGIHSVPAVIINDRHLISGGQPAEVFEQALRQIAAAG
ncbi:MULTISPECIES: DsbA family oxidoreductase [unclassified Polaromonas]|uniref:DsbA family oxidoreductase n=1 Tax=unclassified Polaromonas TaxID=2638319 RepID=UPI000F07C36B|nr:MULTISPECIES: DsbA family oxidoreductase [unclassified Polaromonas]AYQ29715.1 DsbA family oxidoreductase [Polaromonas sp. SP1]QGJ19170.1 disulfide bond formation protein DsbA [Polaromonas sp. Pch-P]